MNMLAAEWMVRYLEARAIETLFGIPGGAVLPLYHALAASSLTHVLARHEQAAGFMAAGQARVTGRAGVFIVSSGPGATNAITALADAYMDSIPLVCIAGQVPTAVIGTQAFQEVATVDMARPVTKAAFFAGSAAELVELLPRAFAVAEGGTNSLTVRLTAQPTNLVTVTTAFTSGDTDLSVSSGGTLSFNSTNWNVPQSVFIRAVRDLELLSGQALFTVSSPALQRSGSRTAARSAARWSASCASWMTLGKWRRRGRPEPSTSPTARHSSTTTTRKRRRPRATHKAGPRSATSAISMPRVISISPTAGIT